MAIEEEISINKNTFKRIFSVIKQHIIVMLSVIFAITLIGYIYSVKKVPNYIAKENINYVAVAKDNKITKNINAMQQYIDTIVDYCDEGKVVERADYLYNEFKKSNLNIDVFINQLVDYLNSDEIKLSFFDATNPKKYIPVVEEYYANRAWNTGALNQRPVEKIFDAQKISSSSIKNEFDENSSFIFTLSYKDTNRQDAREKLRILFLALKVETFNAFGGVNTILEENIITVDSIYCREDFSKNKTIMIFFFTGVVLSLLVVYLINLANNTISSKKDLEDITESNVLSAIEKLED